MAFERPALRYAHDALAPAITKDTVDVHYDKHHKTYCDKYNAAVAGTDWDALDLKEVLTRLSEVPQAIRTAVKNNGGGAWNHALYWESIGPQATSGEPTGALKDALIQTWGSVDAFLDELSKAAAGQFGSGWAFLIVKNGTLSITTSANQDCPLSDGAEPILALDVWEHAYYLDYQNRRPDYIHAYLSLIQWDRLAERYDRARA